MNFLSNQINEALKDSLFFGAFISIFAYMIGVFLKKKLKLGIFNPLLVAIIIVIVILLVFRIDYDTYESSAKYLSYLLTPATVSLAIGLYEQLDLLKKHFKAIIISISCGVCTSLVSVYLLALLFKYNHTQYVTLLPKSITTAIGMQVSQSLNGYVTITVAVIIITGILGNMLANYVFKVFKIDDPIARGLALGTSSHAIGTAKAIELGEVEGAMSGLSIAISGILTVILVNLFQLLI